MEVGASRVACCAPWSPSAHACAHGGVCVCLLSWLWLACVTVSGGGGGVAVSGTSVYSPSWGTTSDPGQKLPSDVMQKLTATASACYQSGGLAMQVAGGGGGGVVVVEGGPGSAASLRYGGGFGFTYTCVVVA